MAKIDGTSEITEKISSLREILHEKRKTGFITHPKGGEIATGRIVRVDELLAKLDSIESDQDETTVEENLMEVARAIGRMNIAASVAVLLEAKTTLETQNNEVTFEWLNEGVEAVNNGEISFEGMVIKKAQYVDAIYGLSDIASGLYERFENVLRQLLHPYCDRKCPETFRNIGKIRKLIKSINHLNPETMNLKNYEKFEDIFSELEMDLCDDAEAERLLGELDLL